MTIDIEGKSYHLQFVYGIEPVDKQHSGGKVDCRTIQAIFVDSGDVIIWTGKATCSPTDRFERAIGRKIALQRAIAELPRETRRSIWIQYHQLVSVNKAVIAIADKAVESEPITSAILKEIRSLKSWIAGVAKPVVEARKEVASALQPATLPPGLAQSTKLEPPPRVTGNETGVTGSSSRRGKQ